MSEYSTPNVLRASHPCHEEPLEVRAYNTCMPVGIGTRGQKVAPVGVPPRPLVWKSAQVENRGRAVDCKNCSNRFDIGSTRSQLSCSVRARRFSFHAPADVGFQRTACEVRSEVEVRCGLRTYSVNS